MTPGVTGETVDGMSLAKIDAIIERVALGVVPVVTGQAGLHPEEGLEEEAPAGHASLVGQDRRRGGPYAS